MMVTRRSRGAARTGSQLLVMTTVVGLAVAVLGAPQAHADTAPPAGTPPTVSADGLPTWQINGVVRSQVTLGNTVYAVGAFTQARPPGVSAGGSGSVAAGNLFAYDITTGNPVPFAHRTNGQVWTITASPNGKTLYIGGDFTSVDGAPRSHIAAIDVATSHLVTTFAPAIGVKGRVLALAVSADNKTVYSGGSFSSVGKVVRMNLAAFAAGTGVMTGWAPTTDGQVQSMVVAPGGSRVIVGGQFYLLDGVASYGMGAVNSTNGARLGWAASNTIKVTNKITKNGVTKIYHNGGIDSLRTDGTYIYGGGWSNGPGAAFEGTFAARPSDGKIYFVNDCHGDTYDVLPVGKVLYAAAHAHNCQAIGGFPDAMLATGGRREHNVVAFSTTTAGTNSRVPGAEWSYQGQPRSSLLDWFPSLTPGTFTGEGQAAWSLAGSADGKYLAVGGEFPEVNGVAQQGLVRFAVSGVAPNKIGPTATSVIAPTAVSATEGTVLLQWPAAWDKDNSSLTYTLRRRPVSPTPGGEVAVATVIQSSTFWQLPRLGFTDTGLNPGDQYQYQTRVTDPFGNMVYSGWSPTVTVSASASVANSYAAMGPCRLFDTRSGAGSCPEGEAQPVPKLPLRAGNTLTVKVAGTAGVPADATAVVLNLTAVGATRSTYLTAWPAGGIRPTASNLNVSSAAARPNLAVVPVGVGGAISVFSSAGSVNLVGDLSGYFAPEASTKLSTLVPCRLFDTRSGRGVCAGAGSVPKAPVGAGSVVKVKVAGVAGVPADATAVVVNLTAVGATRSTWVVAWPTGKQMPRASNLNVYNAAAIPNLAIVPIGADGTISLYNSAGSVNLLGDISGYFSPVSAGSFSTLTMGPCRIFDTRSGMGSCADAPAIPVRQVGPGGILKVKVRGVGFIPSTATAVVINLTAVGATASTWVAAWPSGVAMPVESNLNLHNSSATPNLAIVPIGSDGYIQLYNNAGSVDLVGDISGYFAP